MEFSRVGLRRIIFETDTPAARGFDLALLLAIAASVMAVMLESVQTVSAVWGTELRMVEYGFTAFFTIEYLLRLWSAESARKYAASAFGLVDLAAILPTYVSLFVPGLHALMVVRIVRLLRVFHIFRLREYLAEENLLLRALQASKPKIVVFLVLLTNLVVIIGALMYVVEGPETGFTSVPRGIYWAVVTISTVGFGDITPATTVGQTIAGVLMMLGYCLIVVPTALVSVELARGVSGETQFSRCTECGLLEHPIEAEFCHRCGTGLHISSMDSPFDDLA